jgi:PAS domain S-box-containing protein
LILLLSDQQDAAAVCETKLRVAGYRVAGNVPIGDEAVRTAGELHPSLVILDLSPPRVQHGFVTAQTIHDRWAIPVVFLVDRAALPLGVGNRLFAASRHVLKPVVDQDLVHAVEASLNDKRLERDLLDQKNLLESTLRSIGEGVIATDLDGLITFMNPVAERALKCSFSEVAGRSLEEFLVVSDDAPGHPGLPPPRAAPEQMTALPEQYRVLATRDGTTFPADYSVCPILDHGESRLGQVVIFRDVSDRVAMSRSVSRLAAIISSCQDAVIGSAADGTITSWNPSAEQIFGYSEREAIGRSVLQLASFNSEGENRERFQRVAAGEPTPPYATTWQRKDGSPVDVNVALSAVRDERRRLVGAAAIVRDITQIRRLEEQLRQAQKMEVLGQFAGGIAHDFNNILTVINGYSNLLLREALTETAHDSVSEIREAGQRGATLSRQLLAFSRRQVLSPRTLNLNKVVAETERMLRSIIGEDVRLVVERDAALRPVLIDRGQIEQVLLNLVLNARDTLPAGGTITIETSNLEVASTPDRPDGGRFVRLSVSDTGTGIAPEIRARIFEPFFTTKATGTGLGLAVVDRVVRQAGGHITVTTTVGVGTRFDLALPATGADEDHPVPESDAYPRARDGETVLLVEDEEHVREVARVALARQGFTVLHAGVGPNAIEQVNSHAGRIDLLITDVVMPEMSGLQLADTLRALRPGLKVLFLSGHLDTTAAQEASTGKNRFFLAKPFTPQGLAQAVRATLDHHG